MEAYVAVVRILAGWAGEDPAGLGEERVREFFLHLVRERGYASKSIRQARAALGSFYRDMLGHAEWKVFGEVRTKDREQLPEVLLREEVRLILGEVKEPRFAVPLRLIYLCGLRLSECLHVEVRDIHRQQQRLHIRDGQGRQGPLCAAAAGGARRSDRLVEVAPSSAVSVSGDGACVAGHRAAVGSGTGTGAAGAAAQRGASDEHQRDAAGLPTRGGGQRREEAGDHPHAAPFVRDAPARRGREPALRQPVSRPRLDRSRRSFTRI